MRLATLLLSSLMLSPLIGPTSHHGTKQAAWYWHKCPNWSCFLLAEHLHAPATPVSHPQHDDLAGFHASPLYSWWIAAADGFLSLKNPVRRAWWIAPDLVHPCAHLPSPPPPAPPQRCARKGKTNSEMWTRSWLIKYRWSSAFLTLALKSSDISALTVSICTSCVNTNMVSVKTFTKKKKKKRWALIWSGHYPFYNGRSWRSYVHFSHHLQLHTEVSGRRGCSVSLMSKQQKLLTCSSQ